METVHGSRATAWYNRVPSGGWLLAVLLVTAAHVLTLAVMGRVPICKCGYVKLWHGIVMSAENSQHISDWYTFSHVIHGFAFYGLLFLVGRRWPIGLRLLLAMLLEASWEVLENSDSIIDRYRAVTISLDYYGDSIINSFGDVLACALGFLLASRLPIAATIALAIGMEAFVGGMIRDNLLLNIIMLLYPLEVVRRWQAR